MRSLTLFSLLALCLASGLLGAAAAHAAAVQAVLDKREVGAIEPLTLTVSVSGDSGQVDISPIEQEGNFRVASRSTSTNISIVNGNIGRISEYTFRLFPLREGDLTIPALPVKVGKDTFMTEAISVRVRSGSGGAHPPARFPPSGRSEQGESAPAGNEVFLEASLSTPESWVGQTVVYTLKIFVGAHIANGRIEMPELAGFTSKELERKEYMVVVNGMQYEVTEVQFLLTPLKAGEASFGAPALNCDLMRRSQWNKRQLFDQFFNNPFFKMDPLMPSAELEPRTYRGQPLTLKVNALPPFSGPGEFSGLVGNYSLKASVDKTSLAAGESATLSLELEGSGNIQDAAEPKLALPANVKVYKDAPQAEIKAGDSGYAGKKVFRYALVPLEPGELKLPDVAVTYFDVRARQYGQARVQLPTLAVAAPARLEQTVVTAPTPGQQATTASTGSAGQKVEFQHKDVLPLKEDLAALNDQSPFSLAVFLLLAGLPPAVCGLAALGRKLARREKSLGEQLAARSDAAFKEAESCLPGDTASALGCCAKALLAAVCARIGRQAETLTYAEVETQLAARGVAAETIERVVELMRRIDAARYAGASRDAVASASLLAEAREAARRVRS